MVKEKRILSYFIGWLFFGFLICCVGITNVFAASYDVNNFKAQLYDNLGPTLNEMDTSKDTNFYYGYTGLTAYSSGGAWGISSPIPLIANHTYSMTVDPFSPGCGFTILSSYPRLGIGTNLANAKTSYQNNTNVEEKFYQAVSNSRYLQYVFTPSINASYIVFPFATTSSCNDSEVQLSTVIIEDLGESGLSQDQINTSLNNQTNELNNSIQESTNTITDKIDDMEQSIVDSNKETQEVIKDQFNTCRPSNNLLSNNFIQFSDTQIKVDIENLSAGTYTFKYDGPLASQLTAKKIVNGNISNISYVYNSNQITFSLNENLPTEIEIYVHTGITPNEIKNPMLNKGNIPMKYEPYGEICSNKIDETNDKLDNLQGALTDSSSTDMSALENSTGWLPAGPVDSILTLPLTMLNNLVNNLSSNNCQTAILQLPYVKKNINLPCIKTLYEKMGITGTLFQSAGIIASAFILFNYLLKLYQWVDNTLTMRENTMPGYFDDNWGGGA